jgi:hypothetical protein
MPSAFAGEPFSDEADTTFEVFAAAMRAKGDYCGAPAGGRSS